MLRCSIKITTPSGVVIFMDTERDFTCSGEIKLPCAKVLAFGQNVCTAQKRRQPEGRLGALSEPFAGSENIQIGVQFHKNRSFRLKRAALFLGEKEPPAILVGFPHMLSQKAVKVTRKFQIEDNMPVYGRPSARCRLKIAVWATSPCFYRVV